MILIIKRSFAYFSLNTLAFLILILVTQNSSYKSKVNFYFNQTIDLPNSFIMSTSFIAGSLLGCFITMSNPIKRES